jgi:hypothetical protein
MRVLLSLTLVLDAVACSPAESPTEPGTPEMPAAAVASSAANSWSNRAAYPGSTPRSIRYRARRTGPRNSFVLQHEIAGDVRVRRHVRTACHIVIVWLRTPRLKHTGSLCSNGTSVDGRCTAG